jgi:DNA-binding transcriptional ArsR family regulator
MTRDRFATKLNHTLVALADAKRRAILRRLAQGEARVTELAAPFDVSLNAISKHIKLLERAGLVQRRRIGREHLLRFRPEPLGEVLDWISKQKAFWQSSLKAIDDVLQQEDKAAKASLED